MIFKVSLSFACLLLGLFCSSCAHKLGSYEDCLVGAPAGDSPPAARGKVSVTYLGTSGYLVESGSTAVVVDPYFSRYDFRTILLNGPIPPRTDRIYCGAKQACFPASVDAWLVTHGHFDHALDLPLLQTRFGGKVIGSRTTRYLMEACKIASRDLREACPGDRFRVGRARIHVLGATHDRILGQVPYPGELEGPVPAPCRAKDWRVGKPLSFLIELNGKRIYVDSGGTSSCLPDGIARGADLAILGVALPESQRRYPKAVRQLCPDYVLPSHQDNFFQELECGFHFAPGSDFPKVLATHRAENLPGKLVLMDYFHRWVLP